MSTDPSPILTQPPPNGAPPPPPSDWRASLPEDLRADKTLANFKDVESLAKSAVEQQKLIGSSVRMPKADAKPEEWDAFYGKLGRPEAADKYEIKFPAQEGAAPDEATQKAFRDAAFKTGLNGKQAQGLLDWYHEAQSARVGAWKAEMETGLSALKAEWGAKYDENIGLAQRAAKDVGGADVMALLESTGLGNHPALIKFFSKLGADLGEQPVVKGGVTNTPDSVTQAKAKLDAIRSDPKHPYNDRKASPGQKAEAIAEVGRLSDQVYGTEPANTGGVTIRP